MAEDGTSLTTSAARLAKASHTKKQTSKLAATYTDERQHMPGDTCALSAHTPFLSLLATSSFWACIQFIRKRQKYLVTTHSHACTLSHLTFWLVRLTVIHIRIPTRQVKSKQCSRHSPGQVQSQVRAPPVTGWHIFIKITRFNAPLQYVLWMVKCPFLLRCWRNLFT